MMASRKPGNAPGEAEAGGTRSQSTASQANSAKDAEGSGADPGQTEEPPRIGKVSSLNDLPAVKSYLRRIGAKERNFRKAVIEETVVGYPKAVGWVTFADDGTVKPGGKAEGPTAEEQEAITKEFAGARFPKMITLAAIADPPPGVKLSSPNVFVLHALNGEVAMIQERYETGDGGKGFTPWTRWDDGQWRKMEPDTLPFYGLDRRKNQTTLFLHEGAKAAAKMQRVIEGAESADRFPWFERMRYGCHVGWIGGTHAADRSDWEGLAKLGWKHVVIVADNDDGGVDVSAKLAEHFRCRVDVLRFDGLFTDTFDLGDPFPAEMWDKHHRYTGPAFEDCLTPGDWATDTVLVPTGNPRSPFREVHLLREGFIARYRVVTATQQVFCADRPARAMSREAFNDNVRSRSALKDTYGALVSKETARCDARDYFPNSRPGKLMRAGQVLWNAYQPSAVVAEPGSAKPWEDYLAHLFPVDADRHEAKRWIATLIARRDIRMLYSLLLVSTTQGVGKSTLGQILAALLGETNVSFPNPQSIEGRFNSWQNGKLLAWVDEIYTEGKKHVYDKLKNAITDPTVEVETKGVDGFVISNWIVIGACSNSRRALYIPNKDRRWFIPRVTEAKRSEADWSEFRAWLRSGGYSKIRWWAEEFAKDHAVRPGEEAPMSGAKAEFIEENKLPWQRITEGFIAEFVGPTPAIVTAKDLKAWIHAELAADDLDGKAIMPDRALMDLLREAEGVWVWAGDDRPKIGGRKGTKETLVLNFDRGGARWSEVSAHLNTMKELGFLPPGARM